MKKVSDFIIAAILWSLICNVSASPVDLSKASVVARNFMNQQLNNPSDLELQLVAQKLDGRQNPSYYVFNAVGKDGFVIISGDDCAYPVIGYGVESSFPVDDVPDALQAWLDAAQRQISSCLDAEFENASSFADNKSFWQSLYDGTWTATRIRTSFPLITSTWEQGTPYNSLCPSVADVHAPVGCVALAMGQIMRYWKHPQHGVGSHGYDHYFASAGYADLGHLSANFANANYQYLAMPDQLDANSFPQELEQVGQLLYHCGVSLNMRYAATHSSSYTDVAADALHTYFGYVQGQFLQKSAYSESQWKSMLKADLDAGRPILYRGNGASGGHAFICDGYDSQDEFHFNWGWSGAGNGYFALSLVNPSGYDFTGEQRALLGLYPDPCYPYFAATVVGNTTLAQTGTETTLSATGGVSYQWNTGASTSSISVTPARPTCYTVTVTNEMGCQKVLSKWVTFEDACELNVSMQDAAGNGWNGNAIVVLSDSQPVDTVFVSLLDGFSATAIVPVSSGNLKLKWLRGEYPAECSFTAIARDLQYSTTNAANLNGVFFDDLLRCTDNWSLEDYGTAWTVSLFPNPSTGISSVKTDLTDFEIGVFDMYGRSLLRTREPTFDMSAFPSGIYLVRLYQKGHVVTSLKFVKE